MSLKSKEIRHFKWQNILSQTHFFQMYIHNVSLFNPDPKIDEHHRFSDQPPVSDLPPPKYETAQHGYHAGASYPGPSIPVSVPAPANVTYLFHQPSPPLAVRDSPVRCVCPNCRANIVTQLKFESGLAAWLIAGGLCLFGLGCGCCLLPFCVDCKFKWNLCYRV